MFIIVLSMLHRVINLIHTMILVDRKHCNSHLRHETTVTQKKISHPIQFALLVSG